MPVRIQPLPTLPKVGEAGIGGIPTQDPMVEQLRILEEEKAKAKAFATEAKLAKEKEASQYDPEMEYSFLKVCRMGQVDIKTFNNLETNNHFSPRASSPRRLPVSMHIMHISCGWKPSVPTTSLRKWQLHDVNNHTTEVRQILNKIPQV